MGCQRGKRDIALDLKQPDGVRIALELIATADVVHHNMTLGTAERLGIGYEDCKAVRPDIIYCSTYMYGAIGPLAHLGGLDPLAQAASGIEWEQGPVAEGNPPMWYRYGHGDVAAAMPSITAVLIALFHRNRTGEGQSMWTSLLHGTMLYTADAWLARRRHAVAPPDARPRAARARRAVPALRDPGRLAAARRGARGALGRRCAPCCGAPSCSTTRASRPPDDRVAHRPALTEILAEAFLADKATTGGARSAPAGVPAEISVDTWDGETILFDDELVRPRARRRVRAPAARSRAPVRQPHHLQRHAGPTRARHADARPAHPRDPGRARLRRRRHRRPQASAASSTGRATTTRTACESTRLTPELFPPPPNLRRSAGHVPALRRRLRVGRTWLRVSSVSPGRCRGGRGARTRASGPR